MLADTHRAAAEGALYIEGNDLPRLLGRPATSLAQVIRAALNLAAGMLWGIGLTRRSRRRWPAATGPRSMVAGGPARHAHYVQHQYPGEGLVLVLRITPG